jgi:hypothetical protein
MRAGWGKPVRWIPKDSTAIERPDIPAVVYVYGKWCAIGYGGKRNNHDWSYRFLSEQQMRDYIANYFRNLEGHNQMMAERKAKQVTYRHDYKVGDILNGSWGYDQTNQEFYQVVRVVSDKTIAVRKIAHTLTSMTQSMAGYVAPIKDQFSGPEMVRRVGPDGSINGDARYISASRWDGRDCYESWYA